MRHTFSQAILVVVVGALVLLAIAIPAVKIRPDVTIEIWMVTCAGVGALAIASVLFRPVSVVGDAAGEREKTDTRSWHEQLDGLITEQSVALASGDRTWNVVSKFRDFCFGKPIEVSIASIVMRFQAYLEIAVVKVEMQESKSVTTIEQDWLRALVLSRFLFELLDAYPAHGYPLDIPKLSRACQVLSRTAVRRHDLAAALKILRLAVASGVWLDRDIRWWKKCAKQIGISSYPIVASAIGIVDSTSVAIRWIDDHESELSSEALGYVIRQAVRTWQRWYEPQWIGRQTGDELATLRGRTREALLDVLTDLQCLSPPEVRCNTPGVVKAIMGAWLKKADALVDDELDRSLMEWLGGTPRREVMCAAIDGLCLDLSRDWRCDVDYAERVVSLAVEFGTSRGLAGIFRLIQGLRHGIFRALNDPMARIRRETVIHTAFRAMKQNGSALGDNARAELVGQAMEFLSEDSMARGAFEVILAIGDREQVIVAIKCLVEAQTYRRMTFFETMEAVVGRRLAEEQLGEVFRYAASAPASQRDLYFSFMEHIAMEGVDDAIRQKTDQSSPGAR